MGPVSLFFLVLATAAPLFSAAQGFGYPTANLSTLWINNNASLPHVHYRGGLAVRPILLRSQSNKYYSQSFATGFFCAPPCDKFYFAVFIVQTNADTRIVDGNPPVVWSANRARPVRENATVELTSDGELVLRDADGSLVWSTGTSRRSVAGMMITNIGNLVLFDLMNATVWQSFDHPTDALVPGQSLLEGMRLTASTSATNWTENQFYVTVRADGLYAYIVSAPPQIYYMAESNDNKEGNDTTKVTFMNGSLSIFVDPKYQDMNSISLPTARATQFMRLESNGHLWMYEWNTGEETWPAVYDVMKPKFGDCGFPTVCGEYGICTGRKCTCPLQDNNSSGYFKPIGGPEESLGCTPLNPISCQEMQQHRLLTLNEVSYFDLSDHIMNETNQDDCKQACLKNCSCRAVTFRFYQNETEGYCRWVTKVFSLQSIKFEPLDYNNSVFIKVQLGPSNSAAANNSNLILGTTIPAIIIVVLLAIAVTLYLQRRAYYDKKDEDFNFDQFARMPARFSFQKLRECTQGFNKKLGEGGFGSVYEGKLGEERVAVKRLESARQGKKEFLAEVETIGSIEHINLVRLIGFCAEKSQRLLVYEYMPRGSLDRWIHYRHNNAPLEWCTRCRIILDIAKGLCYLHEECRRKIAHLDIKPQNILLDEKFNAKVADFGLSKLIDRDQSKVMTVMRGTPGYLAPEWLTSQITEKVDVYSFGVVVMELISGRKNIDNSLPEASSNLINLLRGKARDNQLSDLIDKHSEDMLSHQEQVIQMMKLAMWCLLNDGCQRPSMSTVIKVLEGVTSIESAILNRFIDANSVMPVQDNISAYSVQPQASTLSGPR
ncbi:G-type lectin S-receptor-like serine/threonine-protein kinase SD2-5 [Triticum urartu]|uniref:Receptor-like serine/threonine-protein kinase n=1 Tax=Triticum urartu TaxID=4572 RepID=M7YQ54_TRIUA|nr:G-type lectin S-receptor-like serine/threonine-protein kinase SD2-5 [Triticum urartu]EMS49522.1 G-type lectin S-receptor-like serine/threonine-protein kinase SD2-5 [Triticum urartu]